MNLKTFVKVFAASGAVFGALFGAAGFVFSLFGANVFIALGPLESRPGSLMQRTRLADVLSRPGCAAAGVDSSLLSPPRRRQANRSSSEVYR